MCYVTLQHYGTLLAQHHVCINRSGEVPNVINVQQQIQVFDALLSLIELHIVHRQRSDVRELITQFQFLDLMAEYKTINNALLNSAA